MPKGFYKHKLLLDEHLPPRQFLPRLNEHFDVKHIKHDLHQGGMDDPPIHELAVKQGRIILTRNIKHFRPLLGNGNDSINILTHSSPALSNSERAFTKSF
jgi:hypothetical protein